MLNILPYTDFLFSAQKLWTSSIGHEMLEELDASVNEVARLHLWARMGSLSRRWAQVRILQELRV